MKFLVWSFVILGLVSAAGYAALPLLLTRTQCGRWNAPSTLKTIASAQADFRGHDRDANGVQDFWRGDVAGLYSLLPFESEEEIRLIEVSLAEADLAPWPEHARGPAAVPKVGYVYLSLRHPWEELAGPSPDLFAAAAFPVSYDPKSWLKYSYIISQDNTLFMKDLGPGGRVLTYPADPLADGWTKFD